MQRWRAWRLRRAQLNLEQFDYNWGDTGLLGGAFAVSRALSPKERERGLRMRRRLVRRVERLGGAA